ncbi:MAG: DUF4291 domain-containing protein [Clostridia bacterium]|nr:DUF4291 domain-containing protein [Clostridia bacterium]
MKKNINEPRMIMALYNEKTIRVYQAYNHTIADQALKLGTFGSAFKMERMTWIKPSFLWMMYRSGWGSKDGQERILAIDIAREGFDEILSNVVLSTYDSELYGTQELWKERLNDSCTRCQWDPDRDIYGNPIGRRAIQLGISGPMVRKYVNEWITKITDISNEVYQWHQEILAKRFSQEVLPTETEYPVGENIRKILGM